MARGNEKEISIGREKGTTVGISAFKTRLIDKGFYDITAVPRLIE